MATADELARCQAALAQAQEEVRQLRLLRASADVEPLRRAAADATAAKERADQQSRELREQLAQSQTTLQQLQLQLMQAQTEAQNSVAGLNNRIDSSETTRQQLEQHYRQAIDGLTKERDALTLQVRLLEEEHRSATATQSTVDPLSMVQLQSEVHDKSSQVSLLNSRLQYAQGQIETLKAECTHLVDELKESHVANTERQKTVFQLEHDKAALQVRCSRLDEVELCLQRKSEEVVHMEQEVLKLVGSLQTCQRETEEAVRRELNARVAELQEMRDQADAQRREKERALVTANHDLTEAKRQIERLRDDLQLYRDQVTRVEKEKTEMASQLAFAGHAASELADDEVHRAFAVAAIKKRQGMEKDMGVGPNGEANRALDLYDALSWDDHWEQAQLREALSSAALDLELAETRCQQMSEQVEQGRLQLQRTSEERDTLLEENIELRRRLSHVQTVFAKQQLQAYRAASAAHSAAEANTGMISFCIRGLECEAATMTRALGIPDLSSPTAVFFSLDGLTSYDTMLSPVVHSLADALDVHFQYANLEKDEVTIAEIQRTTFTFQLHRSTGEGSTVVGMAELPGMALLAARELSLLETLTLIDGEGRPLGSLAVELCCSRLMLPVLLDRPVQTARFTMSAAEVRSALVSLRAVRALRVEVFRAQDLPSTGGPTLPQPYVFYTAHSPSGALSSVSDTVVRPSNRNFTTDPVFDAAPVDHRVVVDRDLIHFIANGTIVFVVFDDQSKEVQANLGIVEVPLYPLLTSPTALIRQSEPLHPQGTLTIGLSWVRGP